MEILHKSNIIVHIIAGSIALILGIIGFISAKGRSLHNKNGRAYIIVMIVVIVTGFFGVFIFKRNLFLLMVTSLSGYSAFSGYRILKLKSNIPKKIDIIVAIFTMSTALYFLYYFQKIGMIWSTGVTYSLVGALFFLISYDLLRYIIPRKKYKNLWIYEHIYKMTVSFNAILSAFTGTVFVEYKPYSQFVPSIFVTMIAIGFMVQVYRKQHRLKRRKPRASRSYQKTVPQKSMMSKVE